MTEIKKLDEIISYDDVFPVAATVKDIVKSWLKESFQTEVKRIDDDVKRARIDHDAILERPHLAGEVLQNNMIFIKDCLQRTDELIKFYRDLTGEDLDG